MLIKHINEAGVKTRQRADLEDREGEYLRWRRRTAAVSGLQILECVTIEWARMPGSGYAPAALVLPLAEVDSLDGRENDLLAAAIRKNGTALHLLGQSLGCPVWIQLCNRTCTEFAFRHVGPGVDESVQCISGAAFSALLHKVRLDIGGAICPSAGPVPIALPNEGYRGWHRKLSSGYLMTDLDTVEWRDGGNPQLTAIVEVTRADEHIDVSGRYLDRITGENGRYTRRDLQGTACSIVSDMTRLPVLLLLY